MAINKVVYGNSTLIDLTGDNAEEQDVKQGKTFHKKDGSVATGTLTNSIDAIDYYPTLQITGTPIAVSEYAVWDKTESYGYYLDIAKTGLLGATDYIKVGATDNNIDSLAPYQEVIDGYIRFYFNSNTAVDFNMYDVIVNRIDIS